MFILLLLTRYKYLYMSVEDKNKIDIITTKKGISDCFM